MKKFLYATVAIVALSMISLNVYAAPDNSKAKGKSTKKSSSKYIQAYENGTIMANAGLGFGLNGTYGEMVVPPISLTVEYNTTSVNKLPLSFGGFLGYAKSEDEFYTTTFTYSYLMFGARASYHYGNYWKISGFDPYFGLMLGYVTLSYEASNKDYKVGDAASYAIYGGHCGMRYFFTESIGIFLEAGYGMGYLTAGLTVKF